MNWKLLLTSGCLTVGLMSACSTSETSETTPMASNAFDTSALDLSVDPCDDFFHYASGGWISENPIPSTEARWGRFNELIESNNEKLQTILDSISSSETSEKGSHVQLVGDLYHSGMDSAAIEALGKAPLQKYVDLLNEVTTLADLDEVWASYALAGIDKPFSGYVYADQKSSSDYAFYVSQSGLGLPDRDYYFPTTENGREILEAYKIHVKNQFMNFGMDAEQAQLKMERAVNIETALAEKMNTRVENRDPHSTYNKVSDNEFKATLNNFDFESFYRVNHIRVDSIIVRQPEYLAALNNLIESTPIETWNAYNQWKLLNSFAPYLSSDFVNENFAFYGKKLSGQNEMKPRWKRVLSSMGGLNEQIGRLFVAEHFSPESKAAVEQMVEDLRAAFRVRIQNLAWMSDETKVKAEEKLDAFTYKIGYPDQWKEYKDLAITSDSYLANLIALRSYKRRENLAKYGTKVDKSEWGMGAHIVNAYYNPLNNEVVFPAGILQPPFYSPDADDAINYGGIGGVIGHEFTHGFDDKGSLYDAEGNLNNWWTEEDSTKFAALVNKVIDQYSGYEALDSVYVNGDLTVGENIADFGGITLAYYAYKKKKGDKEVADIDGLTDYQRVFLGWAQVWQSTATPAYTLRQVATDPHSPAPFRVNGPMSNMDEFEQAWGCESGVMMRPKEDRIVIW